MKKINLLQLENLIIEKKIIIFGGNKSGMRCIEFVSAMGLDVFMCVDNSSVLSGKIMTDNIVINAFNQLKEEIVGKEEEYIIIIASSHYDEISLQIETEFKGKCLYCYYNVLEDIYANYCFSNLHEKYIINPEDAIEKWAQNLLEEVRFWIDDVARPTGIYNNMYINDRSKNKLFECKQLSCLVDDNSIVMDVGCGICSKYGDLTPTGQIKLVAVDPLAHQYNEINKIALEPEKLNSKLVEFGLFEYLDTFYPHNFADVILIDNALDHCFDPIRSITSCINVLKLGGTIAMVHTIREAVNQNYKDLHQWNLDSNENGDFIVWNMNGYVNVTKKLKDYAEITILKEDRFVSKKTKSIAGSICITIKKKKEMELNQADDNKYLGYTLSNIMKVFSKITVCEDYIDMMKM